MSYPPIVKRLVSEFAARRPMRAKSLIITFFGDIASQHGHTIWLGSLIPAMAKFGINERLVRTSVFRLVQEDWLEANRVGRRSYYRFSSYGTLEYERAASRIYSFEDSNWPGTWQLVLPVNVPEDIREKLNRSLRWQGYRNIASGTLGKPGVGGMELLETLTEFNVADKVLVMNADAPEFSSPKVMRDVVYKSWNLEEVAIGYSDFLARFKPFLKWLRERDEIDPEIAFMIRLLMIHDYRRLLLKDTPIPGELLPPAWPGVEAREATAEIYRNLTDASHTYITENLEGGNGLLPGVSPGFNTRFQPGI